MEVILLERVEKLGSIGDVVNVKNGFARNYLLPNKKALRANEANRKVFEANRAKIEADNAERRSAAEKDSKGVDGKTVQLIRQASNTGQLYGSVSARDIVEALDAEGAKVTKSQVVLARPIKGIGMHDVKIALHPEVAVTVHVNVARSPEEAELQAQGIDVIQAMFEATGGEAIVTSDVGQHQMWAAQYYGFTRPRQWINSGGLGTMGYAVPAAVGAKVGRPDRMVWAIDGDGCFQMTAQELVTASSEQIPVKIAILNNAYLGMVRQWQELFYEERYSEVYLSPDLPDYVKWAEAMGCVGMRVDTADDVVTTIEKANAINDRPVVIDFRTDWREKVYPMVPAGGSNDNIILGPEFGEGGR